MVHNGLLQSNDSDLQLWGLCLEMVDVAGYSDPEYVRQLWDVHLKAAADAATPPDNGESTR